MAYGIIGALSVIITGARNWQTRHTTQYSLLFVSRMRGIVRARRHRGIGMWHQRVDKWRARRVRLALQAHGISDAAAWQSSGGAKIWQRQHGSIAAASA